MTMLRTMLSMVICVLLAVISTAYPQLWDEEFDRQDPHLGGNYPMRQGDEADYDNNYLDMAREYGSPYEDEAHAMLRNLGKMELDEEWPKSYVSLSAGQVGGVAVDEDTNVHVFHRGSRTWQADTFDKNNVFTKKDQGPIKQDAILKLEEESGKVLKRLGKNQFYLPHGITLCQEGNYWLTDVAMHQVFKIDAKTGESEVIMGKAFEPATGDDDQERLCKPTDVAVSSNGDIFIADGYCNHRIIRLAPNGTVVDIIVEPTFNVVHSLALAEDLDLLCAADRENSRIVCYRAGLAEGSEFGEFDRVYDDKMLGRVFAITYSPVENFLFAMTESPLGMAQSRGFTIDLAERDHYGHDIISMWAPNNNVGFDDVHDISVSSDGQVLYAGSLNVQNAHKVWKFENNAW